MIIRAATAADDGAVVALWDRCGLTRPWNPPLRDLAFLRAEGHGALLLAEDEGAAIGSVMVGHDGHRGWIYYLAVTPARQRSGLGRRLVEAAEAWCRERGVPKVMLLVRPENAAVRAFYERIGFVEEPRVLLAKWLA
jgi:ribosomal protein S18 acetylase RimI-like enzyme